MHGFAWARPPSHHHYGPRVPYLRTASIVLLVLLTFFLFISFSRLHSDIHVHVPFLQESRADPLLRDVLNHTLGFQNIFVLGLPTRTDHRDAIDLSAAATNLTVDWIDGVTEVQDKALPIGPGSQLGKEGIGSWRAHMNALQKVVRENINSALILEDDADWDIRIKKQMYDFALSSRALTQPLSSDRSRYADPTYPGNPDSKEEVSTPISFEELPGTAVPKHSPYGDNWDLLWFGHCGVKRPGAENNSGALPSGYVVHNDDETVTEPHYYHDFRGQLGLDPDKGNSFPNHTRIIHFPQEGFCSAAYAVSQRGARKMLWYMAIRAFDGWFDSMLPNFCEGKNTTELDPATCLTVQPPFFDQHKPHGESWKESDIFMGYQGFREVPETPNIRWSTRINLPKLLSGKTDYTDQWPNTG